MAFRLIFIL